VLNKYLNYIDLQSLLNEDQIIKKILRNTQKLIRLQTTSLQFFSSLLSKSMQSKISKSQQTLIGTVKNNIQTLQTQSKDFQTDYITITTAINSLNNQSH
jgi:predicted  nucleic acid-binding Zn-ribbon protein